MSVKVMNMVWDMPCPQEINGEEFRSAEKFVLMAFADHADDEGGRIWPSMATIARKTGYDERTVQRRVRLLEKMGLLLEDGKAPRGTRRWRIPLGRGGILPGVANGHPGAEAGEGGDNFPDSSGDSLPPELESSESSQRKPVNQFVPLILAGLRPVAPRHRWLALHEELARCSFELADGVLRITGMPDPEYYQDRYARLIERCLTGGLNQLVTVRFSGGGDD